jgi:4'-phosphopantetheinyl transferase
VVPAPIFLRLFALPDDQFGALAQRAQDHLPVAEGAELRAVDDPVIRSRRTLRRALARRVLGDMLGLAPAAVPIVRAGRGKPELSVPFVFNSAGRAELVAVACSRDGPVGVDIEAREPRFSAAVEGLLEGWMTSGLRRTFGRDGCAPFRAWTAVEAIRKASGDGIGLGNFRLTSCARAPAVIREEAQGEMRFWRLHQFTAPAGNAAGRSVVGSLAWPSSPDPSDRQIRLERLDAEETTDYLMG